MKIIDSYVSRSFIKNYAISFMVLVGMYVVLDMVFNFNNLVQFQATGSAFQTFLETMRDICDYYFYQCFLFFVQLSGIIPVVAAAFTLMRLSRFNELTALLAAGVPLLRIAMPIIIASLLLNGLLLVDQEMVIPRMIPKLTRDHGDIHQSAVTYYSIDSMQDADGGLLRAARYYPSPADSPPYMEEVDVIQRSDVDWHHKDATGADVVESVPEPYARIQAAKAVWDAAHSRWALTNGERFTGLRPDDRNPKQEPCAIYFSGVTPEEIALYRSGNFVDLLSTARIDQLLLKPKSFGQLNLWRVKHWRFTQPLMNVILLLLAIPCVLTREPGRLKTAATKTLVLTGVAMGAVFLSQQFAATPPAGFPPDRWTALMAWTPVFIFGPISVFLLDRVKT
jgi:lipopolysaccharide export system permease protein